MMRSYGEHISEGRHMVLNVWDLHVYYGHSHVLRGVSLSVARGEVVTLVGRNGMGKTTTLHAIAGLVPCRTGRIELNGEDIAALAAYNIARRGVALVPQGRRIFPSLTVRENLLIGARSGPAGKGWSLDRVYQLFPALKARAHVAGTLLSGGEQQMLAIGRALMSNPEILLMDEPSEGLAPTLVARLGNVIRNLHRDSLTILLVEQNMSLALAVTDRVYVMAKGNIAYTCTADQFASDTDAQARYLAGDSKRASKSEFGRPVADTDGENSNFDLKDPRRGQ